MKSLRRITVLGPEDWQFRVFAGHTVIFDPRGTKYVVSSADMIGRTPSTFERGQYKKTSDGMVTPKYVAAFIQLIRTGATMTGGGGFTWARCKQQGCKEPTYADSRGFCVVHLYQHFPRCQHVHQSGPSKWRCQNEAEPDGYCSGHWPGCEDAVHA